MPLSTYNFALWKLAYRVILLPTQKGLTVCSVHVGRGLKHMDLDFGM